MPAKRRPDRETEALRFPIALDPPANHPPATVEMILAASAEMLPVWNADPKREERRLAQKSDVRFTLRRT
jgi:hypothetical protein